MNTNPVSNLARVYNVYRNTGGKKLGILINFFGNTGKIVKGILVKYFRNTGKILWECGRIF
jgi:hypothetical protein